MGKRSSFEKRPHDTYPTPHKGVLPLLPHLRPCTRFTEPCAGSFALAAHLTAHGHLCLSATDIQHGESVDALSLDRCVGDCFITNPPWSRHILHPMIGHLSAIAPTWLLFDADWFHTQQSRPYLPYLHSVISVGRLRWIPGTTCDGKDNCCWYLFDQTTPRPSAGPVLFGRAA